MKYWFFDGNDVIGPFTVKELAANKGFGAASLVCPENFSEDGDHWQPALSFAEIKEWLGKSTPPAQEEAGSFEEELDTLLKERSPLSFDEAPTDGPALEIPKKPSKPGPIEDYFNNIKEEDLGNILGIPDPNDDSDMDLAHALEKQLAKTSSTRRRQREEENAVEEQPKADIREATHHVATVTEVFGTKPKTQDEPPTLPPLPSSTLPVLQSEVQQPQAQDTPKKQSPAPQPETTEQAAAPSTAIVASTDFAPQDTTPATDVSKQKRKEKQNEPGIIPNPALLRAEQVEVNSVRARLKQTQEMKDFLNETQNSHLKRQYKAQRRIMVILLAALAIMIALVCTMQLQKRAKESASTKQEGSTAPTNYTHALLNETIPTPTVPAPVVPSTPDTTQEQQALSIVQNHQLSGNRGTIVDYLNRIYHAQLSQGYTASWGVEPLYKNTYVVKYQLTKTRKEPIIYVFQANVATQKLTGALNNISLDLVGKI